MAMDLKQMNEMIPEDIKIARKITRYLAQEITRSYKNTIISEDPIVPGASSIDVFDKGNKVCCFVIDVIYNSEGCVEIFIGPGVGHDYDKIETSISDPNMLNKILSFLKNHTE